MSTCCPELISTIESSKLHEPKTFLFSEQGWRGLASEDFLREVLGAILIEAGN